MASSSYSVYTCVVWNVNTEELSKQLTSNTFTLFGSEKKLVLHGKHGIPTKLKLTPQISSYSDFKVIALLTNDYGILHSSKKTMSIGCDEILTYSCPGLFPDGRIKIICIFQSDWKVLSVNQNSPESEMICFTSQSKKPSLQTQALDSNLENLSSDFGEFLKDATFTDVTLKCHDSAMSAHRSVLAARSPVFAAMFRNKMAECENGVVEMADLDPDVLELFLKFLYSGKITNLSEKNVSILFSTSDKYDVRSLQKECSKWIIQHLTLENCISFLQLADTHNYNCLKNSVVEFIVGHPSVFQTEEWSQLKDFNSKLANFVYEKYICKLTNITIA